MNNETKPLAFRGLLRHGLGFLISGGLAFLTDAIVLEVLTSDLAINPIGARLASISVAMVVGWLSHRRLTFALSTAPTLGEFIRYAAVAWFSAGVNYAVFVIIMLMWPETLPLMALFLASGIAMFVSYVGMRFGAFRVHDAPRF
jgi:putative flippase GtrA